MMATEWDFILRLCVAGLCGTAIGLDREYRVKDAGFRTHFLVALGSALMMVVSQYGFEGFLASHDGLRLDPSRIAAQVVSGIGFIGAGTIIIHRQLVRGLTTAASLWATAGIGLAAGAHMYMVAAAATVLTLFGLEVLTLVFGELGRRRTMIVFSAADRGAVDAMFARLESRDYSVRGGGGAYARRGRAPGDAGDPRQGNGRRGRVYRPAAGESRHHGGADRLTASPFQNQRPTSYNCGSCAISFGLVPGSPSGIASPSRSNSSVQKAGIEPSAARKFIGRAGKRRRPSGVR